MSRRILLSAILSVVFTGSISGAGGIQTVESSNASKNVGGNALSAKADECRHRLIATLENEGYQFTPEVRRAFLSYSKTRAMSDLESEGKSLPKEFLAWIDADPDMEAGVYGTRQRVADVLLVLFSLRQDLGKSDFEKYRQLALAAAVVHAKSGPKADITPHEPIRLVIGGDPRKPVDTNEPGRKLDSNDHIINFLNEHTIEEEVVIGYKEELPEPKLDKNGVAIPARKAKPRKVPIIEKRTRSLYAADVLASEALQAQFNAYMKSKGQKIEIDCGERVIHWKSRNMVRGEQYKKLNEAYLLFRTAYEAKGLLPASRDAIPSPGERCAYLVRNDKYRFPAETAAQRKWPRFPLTAPWPIMTLLVADNQPLREREERWVAFRDEGVFKKYGEYIGSIAQQHAMQSARRLAPHAYTYGTIQMMLKDGGVCGAMANISARSHNILGIPSCTASQPGHCALVTMRYDEKTETYACRGSQYVTGGDDRTGPHTPWFYGDVDARRPMVYHQSIAWAVNYGMRSYLDSNLAYAVFRLLPEDKRDAGGARLLESGLAINPYNFLLTDAAQALATTAQQQIRFWQFFRDTLATVDGRPGCPADGLYNKTVKNRMFANLAKLPVPSDRVAVGKVHTFLQDENCDLPAATIAYQVALDGLQAVLSRTNEDYRHHLTSVHARASRENDLACSAMAASLKAVAAHVGDGETRRKWAGALWELGKGREKYFGHQYRVATEPSLPMLARWAGRKMLPETELMKPVLDQVAGELQRSVAGERTMKQCKALAAKIAATERSTRDAEQKSNWLERLGKLIDGHETFRPRGAKPNTKPLRDPCADAITKALAVRPGQ